MTVSLRPYRISDIQGVGNFLVENYQPGNRDGNWLRPEWDYMHSHPNLDQDALDRIGVWEDSGKIIALAHYDSTPWQAFFQVHPEHSDLKAVLLEYAEEQLFQLDSQGRKTLRIYLKDYDSEFERVAQASSYQLAGEQDRPMTLFPVPAQLPGVQLPEGFALKSLVDENDLARILWRGFDHRGEPPEEGLEWRRRMQSSPQFRKDLNLVVAEPGGNYVCYCGFWYEETNHYAYIEPLATDPDFRRIGLAGAAVREGIRRCASLGVREIFVGSDQSFYRSLGFRVSHYTRAWRKEID